MDIELYIDMPSGYPPSFDIERYNKNKQRKKRILGLDATKNIQRQVVQKLKKEVFGSDINYKEACNQPEFEQFLWLSRGVRFEVGKEIKPHWDANHLPEWDVLNRFCQKRFGLPYFHVSNECISNREKLGKAPDWDFIKKLPEYYQCAFIISLCDNSTNGHIKQINLHLAVWLLPNIFDDLHRNDFTDEHFEALWAITSLLGRPWPLLSILASRPDFIAHYDYLEWDDEEQPEASSIYSSNFNPFESNISDLYKMAGHSAIAYSLRLGQKFLTNLPEIDNDPKLNLASYSQLIENINNLTHIGKQLIFKDSGDDIEKIRLHIELVNGQLNSVYESLDSSKIDYFRNSIIELCDIEELDSVIASKISELSKTDLDKYFEHKILKEETSELTLFGRDAKPLYTLLREAKMEFSKLVTAPIENAERIGEAATEIKEYAEKLESKVDSAIVRISDQLLDLKGIFTPYITEKCHKLNETPNKDTDEISLKEKEISALKLAHENTYSKLLSFQSKAKQLEGTLAALKSQEQNDTRLVEPDTFSNLVEQSLLNKKSNPELCLVYIENKYNNVVILPSAYKSIKESSEFKRTPRMLVLLKALAEEYAPAIINGIPDSEAKGCFSHGAYKANESYPVSSNKRLMKYRTFRYNNKPIVMEQHIGIGTSHNKQETIRIYFKIIDEKIIIGYAGSHLPNE